MVGFWEGREFVLENFVTGKQTTLAPLVAHLLNALDDYLTVQEALVVLTPIPRVRKLIEQLIAQDILVIRGSTLDEKERRIEKVWRWTTEARYFHFSTQQVAYEEDPVVESANLARLARDSPPPSPFKEYPGENKHLPGDFVESAGDFWEVLRKRRTWREFARVPISLEDFSKVLLWTWGKTRLCTDPDVGEHVLKTSPSGGARHPIEVYPVVLRVESLEPGIYHYSVRRHGLELVRPGFFEDMVISVCFNQAWVGDSAAVFFMTGLLARTMWKYSHSRAYRVLLLDAGHLGQTFHLVCTRLGLAPFTTAATKDSEIEKELGLDGVSEVAIYTAATGLPK